MGKTEFRLNPALKQQWREAIGELALAKKSDAEGVHQLVTQSAKRFVKNVAGITPPATGVADSFAKKRGEAAIAGDVGLTLEVMPQKMLSDLRDFHGGDTYAAQQFRNKKGQVYLQDQNHILWDAEAALRFHLSKRLPSTGRPSAYSKNGRIDYNTRRREYTGPGRHTADDIGLVTASVKQQVIKTLQKGVGRLAAGLNAAAQRLGLNLPAWIKRHGSTHGSIEVQASPHGMRIRIINDVPFVDGVKGYAKKWDWALQKEIKALVSQVKVIFAKKAARAQARMHRR